MARYTAQTAFWNGCGYETVDQPFDLKATDLDDAISEVEGLEFDDSQDYDYEVTIFDEDDDVVHVVTRRNSVAENKQNEMDATWESEGDYETRHLGLLRPRTGGIEWYTWEANGGRKGAHNRQDGSGRWIERYEMPREIGAADALAWLVEENDLEVDEALDQMADETGVVGIGKFDLIKEIGAKIWSSSDGDAVYHVPGAHYTVQATGEIDLATVEEAIEFVEEREEDEAIYADFVASI